MKKTITEALLSAAGIQKEYFNKSHTIAIKESISSIVTEVDVASEKCIMDLISQRFPDHNLLGEESGLIDHHSEYTWVIDPLDGTSNYAAGLPWFGILIALFRGHEPVMAGACLPVRDSVYFAEKGKGCMVNGEPIKIKPSELHESLFAFSTDYAPDVYDVDKGIALYRHILKNSRNIRCTNSLMDMMCVLDGNVGGCINLVARIWDVAAPYLLIKEAGGVMCNPDGSPMAFELSGATLGKNYPIICGSEPLVKNLIENFAMNKLF